MTPDLLLRVVAPADIGVFFEHQNDPEAIRMVAFISKDPSDRGAFDAKWSRLLADRSVVARTIVVAGQVAGYVASFQRSGRREVAYWIGRAFWGQGVATEALRTLLDELRLRPIYARASKDHAASLRVLAKCAFVVVEEDRSPNARGELIEELVLELR